MSHAAVENHTPFLFEPLYLVDEQFRPLLVPVVKATLTIGKDGRCTRADEQVPLCIGGECHGEDVENSSYRYEPEVAFVKRATDVVLNGHAYAARAGTTEMRVGLRVGPMVKEAVVCGDRVWFRSAGSPAMTKPIAFEKIPLQYERAFGGWDRTNPDPKRHVYEQRNPVGMGFRPSGGISPDEHIPVPNIEDPRARIGALKDRPPPAGFGFVSPHWQPRAPLAGTYDEAWQKGRAPLLPKDFDRRHLNAASPGLIAPGYLKGDEAVTAAGVTPEGMLQFSLPGLPPPEVRIVLVNGVERTLALDLDTVIIEPDDRRVLMLWRGNMPLRIGPHDVKALEGRQPPPAN